MITFITKNYLYVAKMTIPNLADQLTIEDGYIYNAYEVYNKRYKYNPKENAEQWKALAKWCAIHRVHIFEDMDESDNYVFVATDYCGYAYISRETHTNTMITAVLALKEGKGNE